MTVRYDPLGYDGLSALMEVNSLGDYVEYNDYEALLKQLTEATAQLNMALRENAGLRERGVEAGLGVVWQD